VGQFQVDLNMLVMGTGKERTAKEFEARMGDSKAFVIASFKSLWGHYAPDA